MPAKTLGTKTTGNVETLLTLLEHGTKERVDRESHSRRRRAMSAGNAQSSARLEGVLRSLRRMHCRVRVRNPIRVVVKGSSMGHLHSGRRQQWTANFVLPLLRVRTCAPPRSCCSTSRCYLALMKGKLCVQADRRNLHIFSCCCSRGSGLASRAAELGIVRRQNNR